MPTRCPAPERSKVAPDAIRNVALALRKRERAVIVMSGQATCEEGLVAAQRVAHASGAMLRTSTQISRMARGRGRVPVDRIPYAIEKAMSVLEGVRHVVLVGAKPPTGFFGYPGKPSLLSPSNAQTHVLARPEEDAVVALNGLADELGAPANVEIPEGEIEPQLHKGPFEPTAFATTLAVLLPENCIVSEDAVTSGRELLAPTFNAAPHDWIQITGGAIAQRIAEGFDASRIGVSLSMGIAIYDPAEPVGIDDLIKTADQQMYRAKAQSRGSRGHCVFMDGSPALEPKHNVAQDADPHTAPAAALPAG